MVVIFALFVSYKSIYFMTVVKSTFVTDTGIQGDGRITGSPVVQADLSRVRTPVLILLCSVVIIIKVVWLIDLFAIAKRIVDGGISFGIQSFRDKVKVDMQ